MESQLIACPSQAELQAAAAARKRVSSGAQALLKVVQLQLEQLGADENGTSGL